MLLIAFCGILSQPSSAESLEDFLKRGLRNEISSKMYHPDGKYIQILGAKELALTKSQILQLSEQNRQMGAQVEILDFKILGLQEVVWVVFKGFHGTGRMLDGILNCRHSLLPGGVSPGSHANLSGSAKAHLRDAVGLRFTRMAITNRYRY
jgi:hypothetical protein